MSEKTTTVKYAMSGLDKAQQQVNALKTAYASLTGEVTKAVKAMSSASQAKAAPPPSSASSGAGAFISQQAQKMGRAIDTSGMTQAQLSSLASMLGGGRTAGQINDYFERGVIGDRLAREEEDHPGGGGGRRGNFSRGNYRTTTWLKNRARNFMRGIPMAVGAAAGLGSIYGIHQGIENAMEYRIALGDLSKSYGLGAGLTTQQAFRDSVFGAYDGMGVSNTQAAQYAHTFSSLAGTRGGVGGLSRSLYTAGAFSRLQGIDVGAGTEHWGAMSQMGVTGANGVFTDAEYFGKMTQAMDKGKMAGRQLEVLQSIRGIQSEQLDTLTDPSKAGFDRLLSVMTSLNANAGPGLQGARGAQFLEQVSHGIQSPGGGGTGMYLLSQAFGEKSFYGMRKRMEEGAFGNSDNLAKFIPYVQSKFKTKEDQALFSQSMLGGSLTKWEKFLENWDKISVGGKSPTDSAIKKLVEDMREYSDTDKLRGEVIDFKDRVSGYFEELLPWVYGTAKSANDILDFMRRAFGEAADYWTGQNGQEGYVGSAQRELANEATMKVPGKGKAVTNNSTLGSWAGEAWYGSSVDKAAQKYGVDPTILRGMAGIESSWDPNARSPKGAVGIGQLMPGTARDMGLRVEEWPGGVDERKDPDKNAMAMAKYFKIQYDRFGGNYEKAWIAYNAGPENVEKFYADPNRATSFKWKEPREYAQKMRDYMDKRKVTAGKWKTHTPLSWEEGYGPQSSSSGINYGPFGNSAIQGLSSKQNDPASSLYDPTAGKPPEVQPKPAILGDKQSFMNAGDQFFAFYLEGLQVGQFSKPKIGNGSTSLTMNLPSMMGVA